MVFHDASFNNAAYVTKQRARVAVEPLVGDEPAAVLCGMHPGLEPLAPAMLATLNTVQRMCGQGGAAAAPGGGGRRRKNKKMFSDDAEDEEDEEDAERGDDVDMDVSEGGAGGVPPVKRRSSSGFFVHDAGGMDGAQGRSERVHAGRPFTLRDLLRWARRLEKRRKPELSLLRKGKSGPDSLPPKVRVAAYEEAADVLAGMLPAGAGRRRVLEAMAACWGLGADAAEHLVGWRKLIQFHPFVFS